MSMTKSRQRFLFAWRNALASEEGPAVAVDRHVALSLSLYMDRDGQSAWPSQDTLARRTGLTDRTVGRALERLCDDLWIERQARKSPKGNRHKRYGFEYRARLPRLLADSFAKGECRSLFSGKDSRRPDPALNGEPDDIGMANAVRTKSSVEVFTELAYKKGREERARAAGASTHAAEQIRRHRAGRDSFVGAYESEERRAA
jgi:hypothetical protein